MEDEKEGYELEISYEEADTASTKSEDLKKSLHAGQIPEAYKEIITKMKIEEVRRKVVETQGKTKKAASVYGTADEMLKQAKEGYFVRDPERNLVYCPAGKILRQKSIKRNGNIRYSNKNACKHCKNRNKCYKGNGEWKEINFTKDTLEKPSREWLAVEGKECKQSVQELKIRCKKEKVVRFFLKPSIEKMSQRMCLSGHPFGTIKSAMGATYFLLRGLRKVNGEFVLFCLGYNIERAKNLLGFEKNDGANGRRRSFFSFKVCDLFGFQ